MMIMRSALLLAAALTLSNCCLTPSGCSAPVAMTAAPASAAETPAAALWDGLEDPPTVSTEAEAEVDVAPPKSRAKRKAAGVDAMSSQSSSGSRAKLGWEDQQAADLADDARLKQKLIICKNCAATQ